MIIVVVAVVVDVENGGSVTSGNKFGMTFAVPAVTGADDAVDVDVEVATAMVDEASVEVATATVDVVKTGNGINMLSMIALCAGIAGDEIAAVAGVDVDT